MALNFTSRRPYYKAIVPEYLEGCTEEGLALFGYMHEDTKICTVVADGHHQVPPGVLEVGKVSTKPPEEGFCIVTENGETIAYIDGQPCEMKFYSAVQNIFSRNTGLLETDWMKKKTVIMAGVGSVGGFVCVELAKCGVGRFVLVDTDLLEIHNLCRHICGMDDVGRLKVDAIRDKILKVNPDAEVRVIDSHIENVTEDTLEGYLGFDSVIVGACDNRRADYHCQRLAKSTNTSFVSIGFWRRAYAGEIFYWIPGCDLPCYECIHGKDQESNRVERNIFYADQADLEEISFEPGLGIDIDFVNTIGVKLIMDILNLGNEKYIHRILPFYKQYIVACNTNDQRIAGEAGKQFSRPLEVKSYPAEKSPECTCCHPELK